MGFSILNEHEDAHTSEATSVKSQHQNDIEPSGRQRRQSTMQQQLLREEEESLELARRLMAEEAMASYQYAFDMLRENASHLSAEDYEALQAVLAEEDPGQYANEAATELEDEEGNLSYETMMMIGERLGDVKTERWAMESLKYVQRLPTIVYMHKCSNATGSVQSCEGDDSEKRCLVCQFEYQEGEVMRCLPCRHYFHQECIDQWLKEKDACPYCRVSIVHK